MPNKEFMEVRDAALEYAETRADRGLGLLGGIPLDSSFGGSRR
jgi:hypothetical protein